MRKQELNFFVIFFVLILNSEVGICQKRWVTTCDTAFNIVFATPDKPLYGENNYYSPEIKSNIKNVFYTLQTDQEFSWYCVYLTTYPPGNFDVEKASSYFISGLLDQVGGSILSSNYSFYKNLKTFDFLFYSKNNECNGRGRIIGKDTMVIVLMYVYERFHSEDYDRFLQSLKF